MKVLSLITHYEHIPSWVEFADTITLVDKNWKSRNIWSKAQFVVSQVDVYDVIILFFDLRFAFIFSTLLKINFWKKKKARVIFTTYLCDMTSFIFSNKGSKLSSIFCHKLRFFFHRFILNSVDQVIVHSSNEAQMYSQYFRMPANKFVFISYCVRADALKQKSTPEKQIYFIAAGHHRDYLTYIRAISCLKVNGVIIAGESDRSIIPETLPENIEVHYDIPFDRYRMLVSQAMCLVLPFSTTSMLRSLGQITAFEAVATRVPIIASRTFQLIDYFEDGREILFFEPGNADDLKKKMELIISQPELVQQLTTNAYHKMMQSYTDQHYTDQIIAVCLSLGARMH